MYAYLHHSLLFVNMLSLHDIIDTRLLARAALLAVIPVLLAADIHKVKGLVGGLPPATALWNLKLALTYYSTSQAQLLCDTGTGAGRFPGAFSEPCTASLLECTLLDTLGCDAFPSPQSATAKLENTCVCTCLSVHANISFRNCSRGAMAAAVEAQLP